MPLSRASTPYGDGVGRSRSHTAPNRRRGASLAQRQSDVWATKPNKFQHKITYFIDEYAEEHTGKEVDFRKFLSSIANYDRAFVAAKNDGSSRLPYNVLAAAFEAAGLSISEHNNAQHINYIVGVALQDSVGGGEADRSTDTGKVVCGVIGAMALGWSERRDLLFSYCEQRTRSLTGKGGHAGSQVLLELTPIQYRQGHVLEQFLLSSKLGQNETLSAPIFNEFVRQHSDLFPELLTGLLQMELDDHAITTTPREMYDRRQSELGINQDQQIPSKRGDDEEEDVGISGNKPAAVEIIHGARQPKSSTDTRCRSCNTVSLQSLSTAFVLCLNIATASAFVGRGVSAAVAYVYVALIDVAVLFGIYVTSLCFWRLPCCRVCCQMRRRRSSSSLLDEYPNNSLVGSEVLDLSIDLNNTTMDTSVGIDPPDSPFSKQPMKHVGAMIRKTRNSIKRQLSRTGSFTEDGGIAEQAHGESTRRISHASNPFLNAMHKVTSGVHAIRSISRFSSATKIIIHEKLFVAFFHESSQWGELECSILLNKSDTKWPIFSWEIRENDRKEVLNHLSLSPNAKFYEEHALESPTAYGFAIENEDMKINLCALSKKSFYNWMQVLSNLASMSEGQEFRERSNSFETRFSKFEPLKIHNASHSSDEGVSPGHDERISNLGDDHYDPQDGHNSKVAQKEETTLEKYPSHFDTRSNDKYFGEGGSRWKSLGNDPPLQKPATGRRASLMFSDMDLVKEAQSFDEGRVSTTARKESRDRFSEKEVQNASRRTEPKEEVDLDHEFSVLDEMLGLDFNEK